MEMTEYEQHTRTLEVLMLGKSRVLHFPDPSAREAF